LSRRSSFPAANSACSGSNGFISPYSTAVSGMNCAIPSAPAGLMVLDRKLLSCQIRLAKNVTGRSLACATAAMALHKPPRDSRCSAPTSIGNACCSAKVPASSAFQASLLATAASASGGSGVPAWIFG